MTLSVALRRLLMIHRYESNRSTTTQRQNRGAVATGSILGRTQRSFLPAREEYGDPVNLSRESVERLTRALPLRGSDIECRIAARLIDRSQTRPQRLNVRTAER